ncbi:unnamed protein product [Phytophthora lilii]|uniref:Unnamed protein product n=1 Tax=Phytophthora lilii TaxID=2077276 RepID=A0A9W6TSE9_9STRA|nr:unnamed protein product [Phytophthora lilii]
MEQEEMAALTFRPQLNRMSERHEGKLKILSSPDTYLQRIQQQSQAHTIKQRRAIQEKEMGEFAECTFKPRTIEAPAYVQRIARSVSLTKALRAQQQAAARVREKPEWNFAVAVCFVMLLGSAHEIPQRGVVVINTWPFVNATRAGFTALRESVGRSHALDAITRGCNRCEVDQCDFTVGYGGSPDSTGETTLDAMILDGSTMEMGAVAQLRRVKPAIEVARAVMEHSAHSILAGDGALEFAKMMGFEETPLDTPHSREIHEKWLENRCQPNYFRNVVGQNTSCPPYKPIPSKHDVFAGLQGQSLLRAAKNRQNSPKVESLISKENHDTIGMVVLAENGHMAAGTSSNGATHKIAGWVLLTGSLNGAAITDNFLVGESATQQSPVQGHTSTPLSVALPPPATEML